MRQFIFIYGQSPKYLLLESFMVDDENTQC